MAAQSSLHKASLQGHNHFSTVQLDAEERRHEFIKEMAGQFVGPMPIKEFIDKFLNVRPKGRRPRLNCKNVTSSSGKERGMYAPLVSVPTQMSECKP